MNLAVVITHTSGVNWGQAIVTAISILSGLAAIGGPVLRYMVKRRDRAQARLEKTISRAVEQFGAAIGIRVDEMNAKLEQHLQDHDR